MCPPQLLLVDRLLLCQLCFELSHQSADSYQVRLFNKSKKMVSLRLFCLSKKYIEKMDSNGLKCPGQK